MIVQGGNPTPEEIAAIAAAIESAFGTMPATQTKQAVSLWRLAARLPACERSELRNARSAWRLASRQ